MQPESPLKRGLINATTDLSSSISTTILPGYTVIKDENGNHALPPLPKGSVIAIEEKNSQAEQCQHVLVGYDTETIVAGKRYAISLEFPKDRSNGSRSHELRKFGVNAPVTLSGNAATDRLNLYTALMNRVNAYVNQYTKVKLANLVTGTGASARTIDVGTLVYDSGTWVGVLCKTVTIAAAAGQSFLVATISGTFPNGATAQFYTGSAGGTAINTNAGTTYSLGQGLVVYDEGGYFSYKQKLGRGGAPFVFSNDSFAAGRPAVILAPLYSHGIGNDMLAEVAEYDLENRNVDKGNIRALFSQAPVSGGTYKLLIFRLRSETAPDAIDGARNSVPIEHHLYLREAVNATYLSALKAIV